MTPTRSSLSERAAATVPRAAAPALISAQAVSSLGSAITGFALNVWVFQRTGSYAVFAVLTVVGSLPAVLLAPAAGVLVDRLDRRRVLLGGQAAGAVALLGIAAAAAASVLSPWLVGALVLLVGAVNTVTWPAVGAAVTVLARPEARARVNGLSETLMGVVTVAAPALGAALYPVVGVRGIALVDAGSYAVCLALVRALRFPEPSRRAEPDPPAGARTRTAGAYAAFRSDLAAGRRWLAGRRDLKRLLLFFVAINLGLSAFTVVYAPYVLSFSSARTLGILLALSGAGAVGGGLLFSATGGPARKEHGVLTGAVLLGACMVVCGLAAARHVAALGTVALLYGSAIPLLNASSQTIWQAHVPPEMQGRIFSLRRMIAWSLNPAAILLSVPVGDYLLAPLVDHRHPGSVVEHLWGTAATGRYGLLASGAGLLCTAVALTALATGWLRLAPVEQPDPH
jgi:DHA3 family macrolide efflux protein-like MFS transporter